MLVGSPASRIVKRIEVSSAERKVKVRLARKEDLARVIELNHELNPEDPVV